MTDLAYSPINTPEGIYTEPLYYRAAGMGEDYTRTIRAWLLQQWRLGAVVRGGDGEGRRDYEICGIDKKCPDLMRMLYAKLLADLPAALEACHIEPFTVDWFETNAILFHNGDRFRWHTDHFQSSLCWREETKRITFNYYLTDSERFSGGELEFFNGLLKEPHEDTVLWFDPYQRHQVREVRCDDPDPMAGRWAISGWVHCPPTGTMPAWGNDPGHRAPVERYP